MAKTVAIGIQDFHKIIEEDCFYIDKSLRKESKVVQTKKQLWSFDNCPFVCISFDFSWLNKGASGQPLYMGFQF